MSSLVDVNARAWDIRTPVHEISSFYDVEAFKGGQCALKSLERKLIGGVQGRRLLHLQCHFGLDTLSWARLGASVVGIDFSPVAIDTARRLSAELRIDAEFVRADVQGLHGMFAQEFDRIVTTYGVLCWLENLTAWARGIFSCLKPGGKLVIVEFHPILDALYLGAITGRDSYFGREPVITEAVGTYADRRAELSFTQALWAHPISEVIGVLLDAGLRLSHFQEHAFCSYPIVSDLDRFDGEFWWLSVNPDRAPFMFSLVAERPGE